MQNGIYAHFQAIASSTGLPIILHDVPARTARELANHTLMRLVESSQFVGLRDGTGETARPLRLSSLLPPGFRLLSGEAATAQAFISIGGDGCISIISNVTPDLCRAIFSNLKQGRQQIARAFQKRLAPLEYCLVNESSAAVKYALSLLGLMHPGTRLPIVQLDSPEKAAVAKAITGIDENLASVAEA